MNHAPILILQMQRMGDLVLSFPLMEQLRLLFPSRPLWVVGESVFFEPLTPLSPEARYFSYPQAGSLTRQPFHAVINLSHRKEAAVLAGKISAEQHIGPRLDGSGRLFINGDWQLYRASLTHNNRYNLYHWADLNALDIIPGAILEKTHWPLPRTLDEHRSGKHARIGLFLGASEKEKHPDAAFWADLTQILLERGHRPVLLGGNAEAALGADVAARLRAPALNLCGRFSVSELARFIAELTLFITPDTGPMHIAARTGTPVLNLSLGPVNPWETGPASPGHHAVRVRLDCSGCWRCTQDRLFCQELLGAEDIAAVARGLLAGQAACAPPGLELLRSGRSRHGLYRLRSLGAEEDTAGTVLQGERAGESGGESPWERQSLSLFWQAWFGKEFGRFSSEELESAWAGLRESRSQKADQIKSGAAAFALSLARNFRTSPVSILAETDFWQSAPPLLHPLSSYIQLYTQNALGSREAFVHALSLAEKLAEMP